MKFTVRALLSVSDAERSDLSRERHEATLRELTAPGFTLPFHAQYIDAVNVSFATGPLASSDEEMFRKWEKPGSKRSRLIASCEMTIDMAKVREWRSGMENTDEPVFRFIFAAQEMIRAVAALIIVANLARPGSLEIGAGAIVFGDGYSHPLQPARNDLGLVVEVVRALGWPAMRDLTIRETWDWCRRLPGFVAGCPTSRGGRALTAFSYQIKEKPADFSPMDLVWAMVGLEALFGHGKEGLRKQISDKSQALLGRPTAFKRRFESMYDYRSRFVHGDLDVPLPLFLYSGSEATSRFEGESYDATAAATGVLIASLQELIVRGWREPVFSYAVTGVPIPEA